MKLGFLTAALPGSTLEQAAQWGAESGFEAIEIACWPLEKATRRYAGVTHIDVTTLDQPKAKEIRKMLDGCGLEISSLAYYPNPLHPDAEHRQTVITRRSKFELAKAQARLHILDGYLIALNNIDAVIKTIREAEDADAAKTSLMKRFKLSELQAQAILDMQLRRLAALERWKIEELSLIHI